jgi:hypothetical protein
MSANANVKKILRQIIPSIAYKKTRVTWQPTGLGKYRVLRIVTPAWKTLPRFNRILKVQKAINAQLPAKELESILRVSVLTAAEYKRLTESMAFPRARRRSIRLRPANGN